MAGPGKCGAMAGQEVQEAAITGRMHWLWPDRANLRRANRYVIPALVLLYPVFGSFNSILAFVLMGFGLLVLLFHQPGTGFTAEARLVALALAAFFAAEALSGLINWRGWPSLREIAENVTFLGFLPFLALVVRGRHSLMAALASFAVTISAAVPSVSANSCASSCRAQHNQCRIATKGSSSCDARLQQCLQSCMRR